MKKNLGPVILNKMHDATYQDELNMADDCAQGDCLLCGGVPFCVMKFVPPDEDQHKFGTSQNKTRCFFYALCIDCFADSQSHNRAEEILKTEIHNTGWQSSGSADGNG